jgi:hypothetical protein
MKAWWGRKPAAGHVTHPPLAADIEAQMRKAMKEVEDKYGLEELEQVISSDFSWGLHMGELSALRWVLGDDWGNGDT